MPGYVTVGGARKEITAPAVAVAGARKPWTEAYITVGGARKLWFRKGLGYFVRASRSMTAPNIYHVDIDASTFTPTALSGVLADPSFSGFNLVYQSGYKIAGKHYVLASGPGPTALHFFRSRLYRIDVASGAFTQTIIPTSRADNEVLTALSAGLVGGFQTPTGAFAVDSQGNIWEITVAADDSDWSVAVLAGTGNQGRLSSVGTAFMLDGRYFYTSDQTRSGSQVNFTEVTFTGTGVEFATRGGFQLDATERAIEASLEGNGVAYLLSSISSGSQRGIYEITLAGNVLTPVRRVVSLSGSYNSGIPA